MPNVNELESMLSSLGWKLKSVKSPTTASNGRFVATIEPPDGGQPVTRDGDTPERALANALMFAQRRNAIRTMASVGQRMAVWQTPWREGQAQIAEDYAKLPVYDEKAVPAWQALAQESAMQAEAIRNQVKVNVTDDPEPYASHADMIHDLHHQGSYTVSRAHADHPIWSIPDTVNFRIAHDVLGHGQTGGGYDWDGENAAVAAHMPMLTPQARRALFTETLGKTAYNTNRGTHAHGPQKIGLMEEHLGPVEKMNGEHIAVPHGKLVYPQTVDQASNAPGGWQQDATGMWGQQPQLTASVHLSDMMAPQSVGAWSPGHTMDSLGGGMPRPVMGSIEPDANYPKIQPNTPLDPNHYYQTPQQFVNPYPAKAGSPEDYLNRGAVEDNVGKFDTNADDPFIKLSPEEQRKTIRNAFAVVILSPKKSLTWNAAHFQAIANLDSSAKPEDLFDAVMQEKNYHNAFRAEGKAADPFELDTLSQNGMNRAQYETTVKKLHNYISRSSGMSDAEAWQQSKKTIMQMYTQMEPHAMQALEFENRDRQMGMNPGSQEVDRNKAGQPQKRRELEPNGMRLRLKTWEMVNAWLQKVMSEYKIPRATQQGELAPPDQLGGGLPLQMASAMQGWLVKTAGDFAPSEDDDEGPNETTGVDIAGRYGGLMYEHLEAIAGLNIDVLETMRQYAVKDVSEDGGKGFIFRAGCVQLNMPGIGPKTASFAWLLIHPQTSELGIIDTHALRGLGFEENALNDKNYYAMERMQRAAKDSTGYADMPQGKYHWGYWDMLRTPGTVSDHRLLRPRKFLPWYDPSVYHGAEHIVSRAGQPLYVGDPHFEASRPIMEQVKRDAEMQLGHQTKNGVKPLNMKPTHYAQGLLPQQPPDEFRADPIWKMKARYTAPSWIDPNTNQPYPDAMIPYQTPAVRAASTGWATKGGWHEGADMPQIDLEDAMHRAEGNPIAAKQIIHSQLVAAGYQHLDAWTIAARMIDNYEHNNQAMVGQTDMSGFENAMHEPDESGEDWGPNAQYPEDYNPNQQPTVPLQWSGDQIHQHMDDGKCPYCGGTMIMGGRCLNCGKEVPRGTKVPPFPEPGEGAPNIPNDLSGWSPAEQEYYRTAAIMKCKDCGKETGGPFKRCKECYAKTAAEARCPGTWKPAVKVENGGYKCPECGASVQAAGPSSRVPGGTTPHRPGGGRVDNDLANKRWKRSDWGPTYDERNSLMPIQNRGWNAPVRDTSPASEWDEVEGRDICPHCGGSLAGQLSRDYCLNCNHRIAGAFFDAEKGPHGGFAGTEDVVCKNCGGRVYGPTCPHCGKERDGTEEPVKAGFGWQEA